MPGENSQEKTAILIIEDQKILRETMVEAINLVEGMEVAGHWSDAESALAEVGKKRADVALIDYMLPGMNGIALSQRLSEIAPRMKLLIISAYTRPSIIFDAFGSKVAGFIHKDVSLDELVDAIHAVKRDERVLSPKLLRSLIEYSVVLKNRGQERVSLTLEQKEILTHAASGCSNKEIAQAMKLAESVVKRRLREACLALGARDRTHAVVKALGAGLISVEG